MGKFDNLIANYLEECLQTIPSNLLDRRQQRGEHLAELYRRVTETHQRLNRVGDAIESGLAKLNSATLEERAAGVKAIRDWARATLGNTDHT